MNEILLAASVIGAIVMAVTQMVKQAVEDNKWLPIVNVVIGILVGVVYAVTIVKGDIAIYAWAGALSGLGAGGFYDLQANIKGLNNQRKSTQLIENGKGKQDLQGGE
ncbi:holin [Vagococcus lutrae]|uniref:holin n=1 Tax=Vagococcus lutrae TaxID=81947 RepID=UPI00288D2E33|nr:holin [Vagococcus lutrae]MDT2824340.1 holin [Vagococcus lutrae]